jgi:hypothetical protein
MGKAIFVCKNARRNIAPGLWARIHNHSAHWRPRNDRHPAHPGSPPPDARVKSAARLSPYSGNTATVIPTLDRACALSSLSGMIAPTRATACCCKGMDFRRCFGQSRTPERLPIWRVQYFQASHPCCDYLGRPPCGDLFSASKQAQPFRQNSHMRCRFRGGNHERMPVLLTRPEEFDRSMGGQCKGDGTGA